MTKFEKIKKKYALNNSYFKNRRPQDPSNPYEVLEYYAQHGELPYNNGEMNDDWFYDCFIEYQKRAGVYNSQFFTPTETAKEIAYRLSMYANTDEEILEPCCGFGQITKRLKEQGFCRVTSFDNDKSMIEACENLYSSCDLNDFCVGDYNNDEMDYKYPFIISNPPYEVKELTAFLEYVREKLYPEGIAVLLIPCRFLDKTRPARLVQVLNDFAILERKPMEEDFARTGAKAEIVVIRKTH